MYIYIHIYIYMYIKLVRMKHSPHAFCTFCTQHRLLLLAISPSALSNLFRGTIPCRIEGRIEKIVSKFVQAQIHCCNLAKLNSRKKLGLL